MLKLLAGVVVAVVMAGAAMAKPVVTGQIVIDDGLLASAKTGDAEAQTELGLKYLFLENYPEAIRWWTLAAEAGHAGAQWRMGYAYNNGYGVPQDFTKVEYWYKRAADQGDQYAQYLLADMYEEGTRVKRDYVRAHMWFNLSSVRALNTGHKPMGD